jgi:hypothetical protein
MFIPAPTAQDTSPLTLANRRIPKQNYCSDTTPPPEFLAVGFSISNDGYVL